MSKHFDRTKLRNSAQDSDDRLLSHLETTLDGFAPLPPVAKADDKQNAAAIKIQRQFRVHLNKKNAEIRADLARDDEGQVTVAVPKPEPKYEKTPMVKDGVVSHDEQGKIKFIPKTLADYIKPADGEPATPHQIKDLSIRYYSKLLEDYEVGVSELSNRPSVAELKAYSDELVAKFLEIFFEAFNISDSPKADSDFRDLFYGPSGELKDLRDLLMCFSEPKNAPKLGREGGVLTFLDKYSKLVKNEKVADGFSKFYAIVKALRHAKKPRLYETFRT